MSLLIIDALNIIRRIHEAIAAPDSNEKVTGTIQSSLSSFKRALNAHRPSHALAIAALVEKWGQHSAEPAIILSPDKDFLQLLNDQVCLGDLFKDVWRDCAYVQEKFGVKPVQIGDLLALMGDAVDGVPGVDKIGRKTAATLLRINGHLERLISNADKVAGQIGANLRKGIEITRLSRQLVSFKTAMPLGLIWQRLKQIRLQTPPSDTITESSP